MEFRESSPLARAMRVHMVGIGGSGMAALASLLLKLGKRVSGSDAGASSSLDALRSEGAHIEIGHERTHVPVDAEYVIRSAAVPQENPEVLEALSRGLPTVKLAEAVGELASNWEVAAVAGTHGKSTTTALLAFLLEQGGLDPKALIGAESLSFQSSARAGEGPLVVEADEYDRRFLSLQPMLAIVTSIELDHLDYYRDLAEIEGVFQEFADRLPADGRLVVCADSPACLGLATVGDRQTYGLSPGADWRASEYRVKPGGGCSFALTYCGRSWAAEMALVGEHNVLNALAAIAAADYFGVGLQSALAALPRFQGVKRRFETRGRPRGIWVVDDYAHHPTAVAATLRAARDALGGQGVVWAVFQPHTTNRTAALMDEFAASFGAAEQVLLLPIYKPSGREASGQLVSSANLAQRMRAKGHGAVTLVESFDEASRLLEAGVAPGDVVLTMGAGDVTRLSDDLVQVFARSA